MKAESKKIIFGRYANVRPIPSYTDKGSYLQLKPLSSISDEDKILIANQEYKHKNFKAKLNINGTFDFIRENGNVVLPQQIVNVTSCNFNDILRDLGYATPQTVIEDGKVVTYTIDELVNEGVFKLD